MFKWSPSSYASISFLKTKPTYRYLVICIIALVFVGFGGYLITRIFVLNPSSNGRQLQINSTSKHKLSAKPVTQMGRFGYDTHILDKADKSAYVDLAFNGGARTVRDDFAWSTIEQTPGKFNWSSTDLLMTITSKKRLDVLAMCGYSPPWASGHADSDKYPPIKVSDYANFVSQVSKRYGAGGTFWTINPTLPYRPLQAIEIWNEPNGLFWLPSPNPIKYTTLLKAAFTAIKSVTPSIKVLSGGLSPYSYYGQSDNHYINPVSFLEKMYQAGAAGSMDDVGWHPYNFSQGRSAKTILAYNQSSAWSEISQTSPSVRSLMIAYGDANKKVWATESGAPSNIVGVKEQANLATQELELWKSYSWAGNIYWYDLRDDCIDSTKVLCNSGTVSLPTNSPKPAYMALKLGFTSP